MLSRVGGTNSEIMPQQRTMARTGADGYTSTQHVASTPVSPGSPTREAEMLRAVVGDGFRRSPRSHWRYTPRMPRFLGGASLRADRDDIGTPATQRQARRAHLAATPTVWQRRARPPSPPTGCDTTSRNPSGSRSTRRGPSRQAWPSTSARGGLTLRIGSAPFGGPPSARAALVRHGSSASPARTEEVTGRGSSGTHVLACVGPAFGKRMATRATNAYQYGTAPTTNTTRAAYNTAIPIQYITNAVPNKYRQNAPATPVL